MIRRRIRLWTLGLLPLIAARVLTPAGFMITAEADGLTLTLCHGVAAVVVDADAAVQHEHAGHDQTSGEHPGGAGAEAPCPFALAAVGATANAVHLDARLIESDVLTPVVRSRISGVGPARADHARGPPRSPPTTIV